MVEIGEAKHLVNQIHQCLIGKTITAVKAFEKPHKQVWLNHPSEAIEKLLINRTLIDAKQSGGFIRFIFDNDIECALSEDFSLYYGAIDTHQKAHLKWCFDNQMALSVTIGMFGFLLVGTKDELIEGNPYYDKALACVDPLSENYTFERFLKDTDLHHPKGSVKSTLAMNQTIPGLGNGTLQEVCFHAGIRPNTKIKDLEKDDFKRIYKSLRTVTRHIESQHGRQSQKDIFGSPGQYTSFNQKNDKRCLQCGNEFMRKKYLGGTITYCEQCQK